MERIFYSTASIKRILIYIVASTAILYFIFGSAIDTLYYSSDDFKYATGDFSKTCISDDGFEFLKTLGRPLQAYVDCLSYKFAYTMERMRLLRFLTLFFLSCTIGLLAEALFSFGLSLLTAFLCATSFLLIQHMYVPAVLMGAIPLPFAVLLSICAYGFMQRAQASAPKNFNKSDRKHYVWVTLSAFLLLCAFLTYPAMAFFFAVLILAKLLFSNISKWKASRIEIFQEVILFGGICLIYFIYSFLNMHFNAQVPIPTAYHVDHPNFNFIEIAKRLVSLGNIFGPLWTVLPGGELRLQGEIILLLLLMGSMAGLYLFITSSFYNENKRIAKSFLLQKVAATIFLLMLSNTFLLVIPDFSFVNGERWLLFVAMSSAFAIILWATYECSRLFSSPLKQYIFIVCVGVLLTIEGYQATISMKARSYSAEKYIAVHETILRKFIATGKPLKQIHFIVPSSYYPYDRFVFANAVLSHILGHGNFELKWCALPRGVPGKEEDHVKEKETCLNNLGKNDIGITYSYAGEAFKNTNNILVIDNTLIGPIDYFNEFLKRYNIESWSFS